MPSLWPHALLLVPCAALVCDDFRHRRVGVLWLAALCGGALAAGWSARGLEATLFASGVNLLLAVVMTGALAIFHTLRGHAPRTFFQRSFGSGDAVMMLCLVPLFRPHEYVLFLLAGCLGGLLFRALCRARTIPLAGMLALTLAGYVLLKITGLWN